MMELTISRVALCACGLILLASVSGALTGVYDSDRSGMDDGLAERLAYMLDVFESSEMDEIVLDGTRILPEGSRLHVHDHIVELDIGDEGHLAVTTFGGEIELDWNESVRISRRRSRRSS
jgi:hypothetical protein